jgi:hypothetical protein
MPTVIRRKKCKSLNRKGLACSKNPQDGSDYCYWHGLGKTKKVHFWKNITVHLLSFIGLIIGIPSLYYSGGSYYLGATKENQELMLSKQNVVLGKIGDLQEFMKKLDITNHDNLIQKYPLGYILFAIDHTKSIIPYNSDIKKRYRVDWDTASITSLSQERIEINLPNISDKVDGGVLEEGYAIIPRIVGYIAHHLNWEEISILSEVLFDNNKEVIILLGFKKSER